MNFGISEFDANDFANAVINLNGKLSYDSAYHIWETEMIEAGIMLTKCAMKAKDTISKYIEEQRSI